MVNNFDGAFSRFETMPDRERQTDGRTDRQTDEQTSYDSIARTTDSTAR